MSNTLHDLQPRPVSFGKAAGILLRTFRRKRNPLGSAGPDTNAAAIVLSREPLIVYAVAAPYTPAPLGVASALRKKLARTPATFLLGVHFTMEHRQSIKLHHYAAVAHRTLHPRHRFIVMCNTEAEVAMLRNAGESALFMNHNIFSDPDIFRPMPGREVRYDAVYNGRLSPQKRHHLALKIDTCALIYHRGGWEDPAFEELVIKRHGREAPGHRFINKIGSDGWPVPLSPAQVNETCNEAHVGLCLSDAEGAMYSSMEYLLAGLPIVNTPNLGGRDVYFDPDYCLTVDPHADAVKNAVLELKSRGIPRAYVRERTLEKVKADRERFLNLLADLGVQLPPDVGAFKNWPFPNKLGLETKPSHRYLPEMGL
jgi:glycosyltransferase involved in cell wall biosynthesis